MLPWLPFSVYFFSSYQGCRPLNRTEADLEAAYSLIALSNSPEPGANQEQRWQDHYAEWRDTRDHQGGEWIPHIGPLTREIHLNLFLDMVPSSSANFTRAIFPRCAFSWRKQRMRVMADRVSSKRKNFPKVRIVEVSSGRGSTVRHYSHITLSPWWSLARHHYLLNSQPRIIHFAYSDWFTQSWLSAHMNSGPYKRSQHCWA